MTYIENVLTLIEEGYIYVTSHVLYRTVRWHTIHDI